MCKKRTEARVVKRDSRYFVIIRQYRQFLFWRVWQDAWRELPPRFLSKEGAADLAVNVVKYLKGKYMPKGTNARKIAPRFQDAVVTRKKRLLS